MLNPTENTVVNIIQVSIIADIAMIFLVLLFFNVRMEIWFIILEFFILNIAATCYLSVLYADDSVRHLGDF